LLAATLYQENSDRNHKLWNIVSTEKYICSGRVSSSSIEIILIRLICDEKDSLSSQNVDTECSNFDLYLFDSIKIFPVV
jgi:hypothetical protein